MLFYFFVLFHQNSTSLSKNQRFFDRFRIVSYNLMMLFYKASKIYTEIDYEQFQLILKIAHSLFFEDFSFHNISPTIQAINKFLSLNLHTDIVVIEGIDKDTNFLFHVIRQVDTGQLF